MPSSKSKPKPALKAATFSAIGTSWGITPLEPVEPAVFKTAIIAVKRLIADYDRTYSRFRQDSVVAAMAKQAGTYTLPDNGAALLELYRQLYEVSGGKVTPLIGRALEQAGYDAIYSLKPSKIAPVPDWDEVMDYTYPNLHIKKPVVVDVGAAGKGYLVDLVSECLVAHGLKAFIVDAGGDLVVKGSATQTVGLEDPLDQTKVIGSIEVSNQSLCGSAGNRRKWADYTHIMDPDLLESPQHIAAVWVLADSGLVADGLSTALFFVPPDVLRQRFMFECAILFADRSLSYSSGFKATFFDGEA